MINWKEVAISLEPPVPEDLLPEVISALGKLEATFRPLEAAIPPDTLPWSSAEDEA
jgi:hypothetical protein